MAASQTADLESRCHMLRSLHRPGDPLLLPNAWDVATARAVATAGFPVVATTSGGVAATLGYEDHEGAPADEMLAAAARIIRSVEVPVTVKMPIGTQPGNTQPGTAEPGNGTNLPTTGDPTVQVLAVGLALLLTGAGAIRLSRR